VASFFFFRDLILNNYRHQHVPEPTGDENFFGLGVNEEAVVEN
jgi:hypothetical protein